MHGQDTLPPRIGNVFWRLLPKSERGHDHVGALHCLAKHCSVPFWDLVFGHTVFPALRAISRGVAEEFTEDALVGKGSLLHALLPSGPQYCLKCIEEDLAFWELTYWRTMHQLPGTGHCPKHLCRLVSAESPHALGAQPHHLKTVYLQDSKPTQLETRVVALWSGLLERRRPIPYLRARAVLAAGLDAQNLRLHSQNFLDKLSAQSDPAWLNTHVRPNIFKRRDIRARFDTWSFVLALALVYEDADLVLTLLSGPVSHREPIGTFTPTADVALDAFIDGMPLHEAFALAGSKGSREIEVALRQWAMEARNSIKS